MEGNIGGASFKERAVRLVFVAADKMTNELPTQTPKVIRLLPFAGLVGLFVFSAFLVLWLVLDVTGHDEGSFYISVIAVLGAMFVCVAILRIIYESHTENS